MRRELGWSQTQVARAFSLAVFASALPPRAWADLIRATPGRQLLWLAR